MEPASEHRGRKRGEIVGLAIVGITLLAPVLGGSTQLWAKAVIAIAAGSLFLVAPPRRSLGFVFNVVLGLIAASALFAFLPANLFPSPGWREALVRLGATLPPTRSPQPWLSLESGLLLWLGLAWACYLFTFQWTGRIREIACDLFCLGILALAAALTICFAFNLRIPFWPDVKEFGFFPNRNQTSNVLGLGGIIIYANAFHHLQRGRRRGWMWLISLGLVCWALILNYSRAGLILFFLGTLAWHLWWFRRAREGSSNKVAWIPLAILLGLLLVAGGETLVRFQRSSDFLSVAESGRALIQRDAIELFKTTPVLGIGLGNFRSLFTAHRRFFLSEAEAIHPESDWLWVATELGCVVALLFLIGAALWMRAAFPISPGTWRDLRVAALIAGIGFLVHGVFDVSGHRIGSLWPALFLASLALNPEIQISYSRVAALFFRGCGVVFISAGLWWMASSKSAQLFPTTADVERLVTDAAAKIQAEDYGDVLLDASKGVEIAPLKWIMYYDRGLAGIALHQPRSEPERDFAIARFLLPNWPPLYLNEGLIWLTNDQPDSAFAVWEEGMRRLDNAPALYADVYAAIKDDADLRDRWRELAGTNKKCLLIFLENAGPLEFQLEVARLLAEDPDLKQFRPDELQKIFRAWYRTGDKLSLAQALQEHEEWQRIGWPELARALADNADYRQAYEIAAKFASAPQLPIVSPDTSIDSLALRFRSTGNNQATGLMIVAAQIQKAQLDAALETLTLLESAPKPDAAIYYWRATLWAKKLNWQKAWESMAKYLSLTS